MSMIQISRFKTQVADRYSSDLHQSRRRADEGDSRVTATARNDVRNTVSKSVADLSKELQRKTSGLEQKASRAESIALSSMTKASEVEVLASRADQHTHNISCMMDAINGNVYLNSGSATNMSAATLNATAAGGDDAKSTIQVSLQYLRGDGTSYSTHAWANNKRILVHCTGSFNDPQITPPVVTWTDGTPVDYPQLTGGVSNLQLQWFADSGVNPYQSGDYVDLHVIVAKPERIRSNLTWDGTATITTSDTSEVLVGDFVRLNSSPDDWFRVTSITTDTSLTIENPNGLTIPSGSGIASSSLAASEAAGSPVGELVVRHDVIA